MPNPLERMRNNRNIRHNEEVDELLKPKIESINEFENVLENGSVNDSISAIKIDDINTNVNDFINANKRVKFEDSHKKCTFWVKNENNDKLHSISKGSKGLKTQIINEALELFFKKNKL